MSGKEPGMGRTETEIIFEELAKNQDDVEFFLSLHFSFQEFYRKVAAEFIEIILWPAFQVRVKSRNQYSSKPALFPNRRAQGKSLLDNGHLLTLTAPDSWPEGWVVGLGHSKTLSSIFVEIKSQDHPAGKKRFEDLKGVLRDKLKLRFPGKNIGPWNPDNSDLTLWFYYPGFYGNWNIEESMTRITRELAAIKPGVQPELEGSFSWCYVEDMLTLAEIVDETVSQLPENT